MCTICRKELAMPTIDRRFRIVVIGPYNIPELGLAPLDTLQAGKSCEPVEKELSKMYLFHNSHGNFKTKTYSTHQYENTIIWKMKLLAMALFWMGTGNASVTGTKPHILIRSGGAIAPASIYRVFHY